MSFLKKVQISIEYFFYDIKNYRYLSEIEIEEIRKHFNELEKSLNLKKFHSNINSVNYEELNKDKELNVEDADDDRYRKTGSVKRFFEEFNRDCYKPKVIDRGFAGEVNNYIKYMSEGDKDEKLSPKEYLDMIRPDLRDLTNKHQPIERLNNNTDTDNNTHTDYYNNNNNSNNNTERGEWKIMLRIYINCTFTKSFNETCTMHP